MHRQGGRLAFPRRILINRRLLLPLTGTAAGESALATALIAARLWNAHVHCLHVRVDARDVAPLAGEGLSGAMIEEMMAATERESGSRVVPTMMIAGMASMKSPTTTNSTTPTYLPTSSAHRGAAWPRHWRTRTLACR